MEFSRGVPVIVTGDSSHTRKWSIFAMSSRDGSLPSGTQVYYCFRHSCEVMHKMLTLPSETECTKMKNPVFKPTTRRLVTQ